MIPWRVAKPYVVLTSVVAAAYAAYAVIVGLNQRNLIYFPTHDVVATPLQPWIADGRLMGYCRPVENPQTIWLMMHGNGGQAAHRAYVLRRMSEKDALYVMEYPGYGLRSGAPSSLAFNRAATEAFEILKKISRTPRSA